EQGVIILNKVGNIKNINDTALKQLKISNNVLEKRLFIQATGDTINGLNEYSIKIEDEDYVIIGNLYNLDIDDLEFSSVIVFKEQGFVHSDLYNMIPNINMVAVDNIIGKSKETLDLKEYIMKIAKSTSTVLITGESGTGKEMIATAIWKASNRKDKNFVAINCAAIPETLLESELFGYVKGAFTGANQGRIGKFEITSDGTLFLDEIGDMPIHLQTKLLRVLQEKEITRVGSNRQVKIQTRIIAATNKDLKKLIEENKFREDLYYRLNVIPVETLPLRERVDDIEDLTYMFIKRYTELFNKHFKKIDSEVMEFFKLYYWKGNVRELENTIEYVINMLDDNGVITMNMLPKSIIEEDSNNEFNDNSINTLEYLERNEIMKAISFYGDNTAGKKLAAKKLGVSLSTLYRKIEKFL
ncbi:sigma 54-interacting transcriptional regulator, partial [Clostridiaceae bacterium HSG29]|nr:sigma 54-interacting transcriptional regulator [Clostridiaceae bacterium HSG29]